MESIIVFSASCSLGFLIMALVSPQINQALPKNRVLRSLARVNSSPEMKKEHGSTFRLRINKLFRRSINSLSKAKQSTNLSSKDLVLEAAGLKNWTSPEWRIITYVCGAFGLLIAVLFSLASSFTTIQLVEASIICFLIGLGLPNYWLKQKTRQRREEIVRTLPDVLDLIMVSVEAGLGFDAALLKVVEKQKGVLAEEFNLVLQEVKMGRPRRDALKDMAKKNDVEDLNNVIASLVQADQLGISIGNVLRNQSIQIRQKRRQRVQEQAQKAPVKIMIPLVFFIFPSIFIVILGPAVLQIIEVFSQ